MAAIAKPAIMEELPSKDKEKDEIVVILRPQNPGSIPQRRLVLTASRPAVPIGRSSKDHNKGFIPADDNAWLENPVMSREHAQLFAKFDDDPRAVYLKDVNSFHGTYLGSTNGCGARRVVPDEPVKLNHGDVIQFGIDIFRASRTYPPCLVNFFVDEMTQKPDNLAHRTFTVPDDVDEEDEDCENEDDLTITAVHTRVGPIDLTRTWSPSIALDNVTTAKLSTSSAVNGNISSNVIDLTSEVATCQSNAELRTIDQNTPPPCNSDVSSLGSALSEDHPSPQVRMRMNDASDGRTVFVPSPLPIPSDGEGLDYHDDLSDEEAESAFGQYSESDPDAASEFTEDMSELSGADEPSRTYDDTSSEIGDEDELSDDYAEDFDDSDVPFPDPYDEESVGSYSSDEEEDEQDTTTEPLNNKPCTETSISNVQDRITYEPAPVFLYSPVPISSLRERLGIHNAFRDRDPSPSDAALFKRRPLFDPTPNDSRAQQLGEKSGKFEFFAARERNRATVNQMDSTVPVDRVLDTQTNDEKISSNVPSDNDNDNLPTEASTASGSLLPATLLAPEIITTTEGTEDSSEVPDTSSIKLGDNDTHQYSAWSASGDRFINNPPNEPSPACQPILGHLPTELDMTSAYMFQQSKLATAAETPSNTCRLPVEDLLAQEPKQCLMASQPVPEVPTFGDPATSCAPTPNKRSYEEAFSQSEDNTTSKSTQRIIARYSPPVFEAKDQDQMSYGNVETAQRNTAAPVTTKVNEHDTPKHEPTSALVQPEASRATKRIRLATTAAQVVACVALGSAATFSYLVNTAPVL
ncbi:hypothetical protein F4859DRAFT_513196 [Xylaria cf. heliscus]|nr:hypothetical protein F4859DRAFT_513196 [Xylaria cf. heliscus]